MSGQVHSSLGLGGRSHSDIYPPDAPERSDEEVADMCAAGLLNNEEDDMLEAINEGG